MMADVWVQHMYILYILYIILCLKKQTQVKIHIDTITLNNTRKQILSNFYTSLLLNHIIYVYMYNTSV